MREALRRILWLVPTLGLVTFLVFWVVARALPPPSGEEGMPLLFNAAPMRADSLAWDAVLVASADRAEGQSVKSHDVESRRALRLLVRLGGAALVHVLPRLDELDPGARRRVALGMIPIAERMRLLQPGEINDGESAVQFWTEFWQDRFVDFKPQAVRRVVRRFAQRSTALRRDELWHLDTYALDELIKEMSQPTHDVATLSRLSIVAAHVANKNWTIEEHATPREVQETVLHWQAWWARHRSKYMPAQGIEIPLAYLYETRYALWARDAVRTQFAQLGNDRSAQSILWESLPRSVGLLFTGLMLGGLLGTGVGALAFAAGFRVARRMYALSLGYLAVPVVVVTGYAPTFSLAGRVAVAVGVVLLLGTSIALLSQRAAWLKWQDEPWAQALRARPRRQQVRAIFRGTLLDTLSATWAHASTLLGSLFLIEWALGLDGIGRQLLDAMLHRDLDVLMFLTMVTVLVIGLTEAAVAVVQSWLEPRQVVSELGGSSG